MKADKWDSLWGMCFDQDQFQVQTALCTKSTDKKNYLQIHMQFKHYRAPLLSLYGGLV